MIHAQKDDTDIGFKSSQFYTTGKTGETDMYHGSGAQSSFCQPNADRFTHKIDEPPL